MSLQQSSGVRSAAASIDDACIAALHSPPHDPRTRQHLPPLDRRRVPRPALPAAPATCSIPRSASWPRAWRWPSEAEVDAAVRAARAAFPAWAATPALKRARVLFKFKEIVEQRRARAREAHRLRTRQAGQRCRGRSHARPRSGGVRLRRAASDSRASSPTTSARASTATRLRQPLGVAAGITPFNFPAMVPLWMFPVALVCGNCFILKPSERDPGAGIVVSRSGWPKPGCRPACSTWSMATRSPSMRCCGIPR